MHDVIRNKWRELAAAPLGRMLLLSVGLHLAVVMVVQPAPGGAVPRTVVINARLSHVPDTDEKTEQEPVLPERQMLPEPTSPPTPAVQVPPEDTLPEPISTGHEAAKTPESHPKPETSPEPPSPTLVSEGPAAGPDPGIHAQPAAPNPVARPTPSSDAASRTAVGEADALPRVPVPIDTRWYSARELDAHPKALRAIRPEYPETARRQGLEGSVKVLLKVDEFGRVRDMDILESDPLGVFDSVVREAFGNAEFAPARRDGQPVRALMQIRVRFELD